MPADLVPHGAIPGLAEQIDSPAVLKVLWQLHQDGFILNRPDTAPETAAILQRLTGLGLADPGYAGPTNDKPFLWTANGNGSRVLKYALESKIRIHPRAHTALASLPSGDQMAVLAEVEALQNTDPTSWPREKVDRLGPDTPSYLLRVPPDLRAFIRVLDSGGIELYDLVREETLRLFLERQRASGAHP